VLNTKIKSFQLSVIIGLCTGLAACGSDMSSLSHSSEGKDDSDNSTSRQVQPRTLMNLQEQVQFSIDDLAQRLDIPTASIKVFQARNVTWRSGALGCPQPGMNYTDALVPGSVIFLQSGNVMHAYHASMHGQPFYCPRERAESPAPGTGADVT